MKIYKVICPFADLLDDSHVYHVGDEFPRHGVIVKAERYKELMGSHNKLGKPLIEEVAEEVPDSEAEIGMNLPVEPTAEETIAEEKKPVKKASTARRKKKE